MKNKNRKLLILILIVCGISLLVIGFTFGRGLASYVLETLE